jgi:antitoxin ParD1/3/4
MTVTLSAEQRAWLEAEVAAGRFASIEDGVSAAVEHLRQQSADHGDLSWAKPLIDEARASLARGEGISLEDVNAQVKQRLDELR